jgi:hypothetical protein
VVALLPTTRTTVPTSMAMVARTTVPTGMATGARATDGVGEAQAVDALGSGGGGGPDLAAWRSVALSPLPNSTFRGAFAREEPPSFLLHGMASTAKFSNMGGMASMAHNVSKVSGSLVSCVDKATDIVARLEKWREAKAGARLHRRFCEWVSGRSDTLRLTEGRQVVAWLATLLPARASTLGTYSRAVRAGMAREGRPVREWIIV